MGNQADARGNSGGRIEKVTGDHHPGCAQPFQGAGSGCRASQHHKNRGARNTSGDGEFGGLLFPDGGANPIGQAEGFSHPSRIQSRNLDVNRSVPIPGLDLPAGSVERATVNSGAKLMRRLDELRRGAKMTQADLARRAGLSRATWFNYLNGTSEITVDAAVAFAHALKQNFRVIVEDPATSDSPAIVATRSAVPGELNLSDAAAQIVAFMNELEEQQQERVLRIVMNAISMTGGFLEPGADEGPAARKT